MKIKKLLLAATIQSVLFAAIPVFAGDVEVSLPAASDAFTVDQPAGTELMRVDGNGNVGIGTDAPVARLHAVGNGLAPAATFEGGKDAPTVTLKTLTSDPGEQTRITLEAFRTSDGQSDYVSIGNLDGELSLSGVGNAHDFPHLFIDNAGNVGINTTEPSNGTSGGGQRLRLDVEGAVGASHYCDENGENCQTAASLAAGSAGTAMAFKITSVDTTTTQTRGQWYKMDTEWSGAPEINTFSNSTFANGTFTVGAGESGLYEIFARVNISGDEGRDQAAIYVNGLSIGSSSYLDGNSVVSSPAYGLVNLAEGDTVDVHGYYAHSTTDRTSNCSASICYFSLQKIGAAATGGSADNLGSHTATQDIDLAANKLVGNGGSEGIAIDAGGKVGIGTTTPETSLEIYHATGAYLTLRDGDATKDSPGQHAGIRFKDGVGDQTGYVGFSTSVEGLSIQNLNDDGGIHFSTGGNANQLIIAEDGNVGIGGIDPASELHIKDNNGDDVGQLIINGGASGNISVKSHMVDGKQLMSLGPLNNPEALNIANINSNVGIGTSDPSVKLHVAGSSIRVDSPDAFAETRYQSATKLGDWSVGTGGALNDGFYIYDYNATDDKNRLTIDNAGNVGIGIDEAVPSAKLEVGGNIKVADSGAACDATTEGQIRYDATAKKHQGCDGTSWNNLY